LVALKKKKKDSDLSTLGSEPWRERPASCHEAPTYEKRNKEKAWLVIFAAHRMRHFVFTMRGRRVNIGPCTGSSSPKTTQARKRIMIFGTFMF